MLKVTITANDSPINVQDPRPTNNHGEEQPSYTIEPNTSKSIEVSWQYLERIANQLEALAALEPPLCSFTIEPSSAPAFAQQPDNPDVPIIDHIDKNSPVQAGDTLVVTGPNLGGGEMAELVLDGDAETGTLTVKALPGSDGNLYDLEVIDEGVGGLAVGLATVEGREVITVNLGGSGAETVTTVAAAINDSAAPTYGLVFAAAAGTGTDLIATERALAPLVGGTGVGYAVTIAGVACVVESIDDSDPAAVVVTVATGDYSTIGLASTAPITLQIRANGKVAIATLAAA
jgi:hypothetical protein